MSVIAFLPVRGGSKSIPSKNIKEFCGRPLLWWMINALAESKSVDNVIVATDDYKIKTTVDNLKISNVIVYDRDPQNATDTASTESVMLEYIEKRPDLSDDSLFILAQATSPLTTFVDVDNAINLFKSTEVDSVLTVCRSKRFYWNSDGTTINYDYRNRPRRQDFDGVFLENGALYISTIKAIRDSGNRLSGTIRISEMPEYSGIEIDEIDDWQLAESFMRRYVLKNDKSSEIKLFLSDVDGVLTDSGMYYGESGDEFKKFNTRDGKGFELLKNAGIARGIITSEDTKIVANRAEKLNLDYCRQGAIDKLLDAQEICSEMSIELSQTAFIGDDINDIPLLRSVGLAACPLDAAIQVKKIPGIIILENNGGAGVVREFVELIIQQI